jgi:hypothetical protein
MTTAGERLKEIVDDLVGEAFCADWHGDPDLGVREIDRIKNLFADRILLFVIDEIHRSLEPLTSR